MRFLCNPMLLLHVQKSQFIAPILGLRNQSITLYDAECLTMDIATDVSRITDAQKHIP
jgi:hypothetical protein